MKTLIPLLRFIPVLTLVTVFDSAAFAQTQPPPQPQTQRQPGQEERRSRRSQRVKMQEVQVASPDGKVKLTILPNAERLTYTMTFGDERR